eukprot:TRINITY_DN1546_c0_g1_i1.p1 TRINITY_DN1546_c0_g1~~TRINITY_DN1546_c0_g1_i1.p1  ORF type:complete len:422 (+),score=132.70 TRINITY_DN1546_c0_g1_i1:135-1400(+)
MSEAEAGSTEFWILIGVCVGLVLFAGLMSGLTLGLMSLDMLNLKILENGDDPKKSKHAKKIIPLVKREHLLLVTLLLCNSIAMEALPIFLDMIVSPILAVIISVTFCLLFGEIIPQALCSRYGLAIGAAFAWFVKGLIIVTFVIVWPLSKLLDCVLGENHATFYRRTELKELVSQHGKSGHGGPLTDDECKIVRGALEMRDRTVMDVMTPLEKVYMISMDDVMNDQKMREIISVAHSRIPVYSEDRQNVRGLLIVKTLIQLDPDDCTPIRSLKLREVVRVRWNMPLDSMLNVFQEGRSHLAVVIDATNRVLGVITLEDVLEELIQEEIVDETDVFVDVARGIRVSKSWRRMVETRKVMKEADKVGAEDDIIIDERMALLRPSINYDVERTEGERGGMEIEEAVVVDEKTALLPPSSPSSRK